MFDKLEKENYYSNLKYDDKVVALAELFSDINKLIDAAGDNFKKEISKAREDKIVEEQISLF